MQPDYLGHFYEQENVREAVKQFMLDTLDEQALEALYKNGSVDGYKEAREVINGTFNRLRGLYAKEDKPKNDNKAR